MYTVFNRIVGSCWLLTTYLVGGGAPPQPLQYAAANFGAVLTKLFSESVIRKAVSRRVLLLLFGTGVSNTAGKRARDNIFNADGTFVTRYLHKGQPRRRSHVGYSRFLGRVRMRWRYGRKHPSTIVAMLRLSCLALRHITCSRACQKSLQEEDPLTNPAFWG